MIKHVNAYSAVYDERAMKPNKNVQSVIKEEHEKAEYDLKDNMMDENTSETITSSSGNDLCC